MNAISRRPIADIAVTSMQSPYAVALHLGEIDRLHLATEQRWTKARSKTQSDRLFAEASRLAESLEAIPITALGLCPLTVADAVALLVMSLAELLPIRDGNEPVEKLDIVVGRPAVAIDRAARLLASHFGISLAEIGGNYCMLREPV